MKSFNSLKRARYRAIARMIDVACINRDWERPGVTESAPVTWLEIWPSRKAAYLSAKRLMSPRLLNRLIVDYPPAGEVSDSYVWVCLEKDADPFFLERRLRSELGHEQYGLPLNVLLEKMAANDLERQAFDFGLVVSYVCAVRLANEFRVLDNKADLCGLLAMRLARALCMLSVDERFAPFAKEVWILSGHSIMRGLRVDCSEVFLSEAAFDLVRDYVSRAEASITMLMLPRKPSRRISVDALREVVKDVLFGLTEPSCTKVKRAAHVMVSLGRHDGQLTQRRLDAGALILREEAD